MHEKINMASCENPFCKNDKFLVHLCKCCSKSIRKNQIPSLKNLDELDGILVSVFLVNSAPNCFKGKPNL